MDAAPWVCDLRIAGTAKRYNRAPRPQSTGDLLSSAIREGDLKLIDFPQEQRTELYDLANDGDESNDLAAQRPADTARLLTKLNTWKQCLAP